MTIVPNTPRYQCLKDLDAKMATGGPPQEGLVITEPQSHPKALGVLASR